MGPLTGAWPVTTRLTVAMEQAAAAATSLIVGGPRSAYGCRIVMTG